MNQEQLQELVDKVGIAELEAAIKARKSRLSYVNVFKGVAIQREDFKSVNDQHETTKLLPFYDIDGPYARKYQVEDVGWGLGRREVHTKLYCGDVHDDIRRLVFSLLGEKNGKKLDEDELKFARSAYAKLKELYLNLYDLRLTELED